MAAPPSPHPNYLINLVHSVKKVLGGGGGEKFVHYSEKMRQRNILSNVHTLQHSGLIYNIITHVNEKKRKNKEKDKKKDEKRGKNS